MRYLTLFVFLAGCGEYAEGPFEEMPVCFEDGVRAKPSEYNNMRPDSVATGHDIKGPDSAIPNGSSDDFRASCIKYRDYLGNGCYKITCEGDCRGWRGMKWPPCGARICLPGNGGWTDPGYPEPLAE